MVVWSKDAGHTPRVSDGWCGVLSIYMDNEFTIDAQNTSAGSLLENFCPLYPLLVLISQQPVCLQDTLFNNIYARHYRPEAVSTSLGICLTNSTKTHFHSSRRQWNAYSLQLSHLTIITTWFWKDGEYLIMNITCLHVPIMCHTVPKHIYDQCTQKYSLKRMM